MSLTLDVFFIAHFLLMPSIMDHQDLIQTPYLKYIP